MRVRISFSKGFYPLLFSSLIILFLTGCAEDSKILDNGQSRQLEFSVSTHGWSNSNSSNNKAITRATPISGSTFNTSNSFNMIADVNKGGNWSTEVNNETVSYSTENTIWQTSATHYWPGAGNTVSFYAYYPTSILNKITHNAGSAPVLSYTVPDNAADQIDILASTKTGVAGNSYNQIPVDFKHIFAAVQFSVGSSGMINGTIVKISLNGIQNTGSYSFTSGWTPQTSSTTTYTKNVSAASDAGTEIVSGNDPFLVMPQTLSNASFTVTYSGGATLRKSLSGRWEAGKVYNYNINSSFSAIQDFSYTGYVQSYTVPFTGTYKLEVWGAEGGEGAAAPACAKGGYSYGTVLLAKNNILYVCVGGQGSNPTYSSDYSYSVSGSGFGGAGGYNGGGKGGNGFTAFSGSGGGGGATHIAIVDGLLNTLSSNRSSVLIVAGGGGGGSFGEGGSGGGENGISATYGSYTSVGGGQTSGYQFGQGQDGYSKTACYNNGAEGNGGAGGGWYGGYACQTGNGVSTCVGGGGGSGYIGSGMTGATIAGNASFTDYDGKSVIGHAGNGYARITFISAN